VGWLFAQKENKMEAGQMYFLPAQFVSRLLYTNQKFKIYGEAK